MVIRQFGRSVVLKALIAMVALLILGLVLAFTRISVDTASRQTMAHTETNLTNLALSVESQLERQFEAIDDMAQLLVSRFEADPHAFDPPPSLAAAVIGRPGLEVLLVDAGGIVVRATRPEMIGEDLSATRAFIAPGDRGRPSLAMLPSVRRKTPGGWQVQLSRRIEGLGERFGGVLIVTYESSSLTSMARQVDLGPGGLIALVGANGAMRSLTQSSSADADGEIAGTPMFKELTGRPNGVWTGLSLDGVERVHAFRLLPGQDLTLVLGRSVRSALQETENWSATASWFACGMAAAILVMALLLFREVDVSGRRERRLASDRSALRHAYGEAEAAKANAEARTTQFAGVLAGMSDGVMFLDADMRLVLWNDRFPAYTGLPPHLLKPGVAMEDLVRTLAIAGEFGPLRDPAQVDAVVAHRLSELRCADGMTRRQRTRPNGATVEIRRNVLPGGGIVTLYSDVSVQKRAEEAQAEARRNAEAAMVQKSSFVATVSHEIRTPLNAVLGSLALLDRSRLSPPQQRLVSTARQAGDALLDLVNDVLDLSQMEAGRLSLRPGACKLRELLANVNDVFTDSALAKGIELRLDVARDVPVHVELDGTRLRQIMMNFLSNAVKFATPGEVLVRVAVVAMTEGRQLRFSVGDPGPRIPQAEAERLFQPFTRLVDARESGVAGTGLGLAICERLVRLMGGRIGLSASTAGGNEFWASLPLVAIKPLAATPVPAVSRRLAHVRVLVVEDVPSNALITATLLRRDGHRVDIADSGAEAVTLLRRRPYDIVFMDLLMPVMGGTAAAREIRSMDGPAASVPIVALTATTSGQDWANCLDAGMDDVLAKPVREFELLDAIARAASGTLRRTGRSSAQHVSDASARPVVDLERVAELRVALSSATFDNLIERCLDDISRRLPLLREALRNADVNAVGEGAHALAGIAATYGLGALEARLRAIMHVSQAGDFANAEPLAQELDGDLASIRAMLTPTLPAIAA